MRLRIFAYTLEVLHYQLRFVNIFVFAPFVLHCTYFCHFCHLGFFGLKVNKLITLKCCRLSHHFCLGSSVNPRHLVAVVGWPVDGATSGPPQNGQGFAPRNRKWHMMKWQMREPGPQMRRMTGELLLQPRRQLQELRVLERSCWPS